MGKTRQSDFPEYPPPSGLTYLSELLNYEDSNGEEFTVLVTSNEIIFDYFSKKGLYNNFFAEEEFQKLKDQANKTCAFLVNQCRKRLIIFFHLDDVLIDCRRYHSVLQ